jgi:hypothetical protein
LWPDTTDSLFWNDWIDSSNKKINIADLVNNIRAKRVKWKDSYTELDVLGTSVEEFLESYKQLAGNKTLVQLDQLNTTITEINNNANIGDFSVLATENQLLAELLQDDIYNEFFYTVIPENNLAIDLGREKGLATLMNPAAYYDINNINNSFVISKLDMDYLDTGLRIARSSLLN